MDAYGDAPGFDTFVLGAGAGGLAAACAAAASGLRVLLLEKTAWIGGTAAVSGGMLWIPANAHAPAGADSVEQARRYLEAAAPPRGELATREAFLAHAAGSIAWLEARTVLKLRAVGSYPDYQPGLEGATLGARVLEPEPFDARALGPWFEKLRWPLAEFMLFDGMMVARADLPHFRRAASDFASARVAAARVAAYAWQRLRAPRGTSLVLGNALVARLLRSALDLGVEIRTESDVRRLRLARGRVRGVELVDGLGRRTVEAARGVVLATGGFSHDPARRAALLPALVARASPVCESDTGDGLRLGLEAGARLAEINADNAYWAPVSVFRRADGRTGVFPHTVADRGKPGIVAVNRRGARFTSEAVSYHAFVQAMFRAAEAGDAPPVWLVCDRDALWRYGLGAVRPFTLSPSRFVEQGYLVEAPSALALATRLGIDAEGFARTLETYNADAVAGTDTQFGLGGDPYQRFLGDRDCAPNPCMRPIARPPFYAVRLEASDLGTSAGLEVDAHARVLGEGSAPVKGLYACGNDMNSIMHGAYPGPGITLGPALVFGVRAGRHMAEGDRVAR